MRRRLASAALAPSLVLACLAAFAAVPAALASPSSPTSGLAAPAAGLLAVVPAAGLAGGAPAPLAPPPRRHTVYLVDVSASMAGAPLARAQAALLVALGRLAPEERVSVVAFSSSARALFPGGAPADLESLEMARRWVVALRAGGGDDMLRGLAAALVPGEAGGERRRTVVLLSDGRAAAEEEVLGLLAARLGGDRLLAVGVGGEPGAGFLRRAAALGGGSFLALDGSADGPARLGELLWHLGAAAPVAFEPAVRAGGAPPRVAAVAPPRAAAGDAAAAAGRTGTAVGGLVLLLACLAATAAWVLAPRPGERAVRSLARGDATGVTR